MVTYKDLLAVIDLLLFQVELHRGEYVDDVMPMYLEVKVSELCPEGLSREHCHKIYARLESRGCINWMSPVKYGILGALGFGFLYDKEDLLMHVSVRPVTVNAYKKEILHKFEKQPLLVDQKIATLEDLTFDPKTGYLDVGDLRFPLKADSVEFGICKYMFNQKVKDIIDWSAIYDEIELQRDDGYDHRARKRIYDAACRINEHIRKDFNIEEDLFVFQRKTVRRMGGKKVTKK